MKLFQKIYNSWWQLKQEIRIWVLNPNFRFCNRTRNARRISPPPPRDRSRNASPRLPNSGFHGFPLLPFYWEMRKRICKTVLVNSVLFSCLLCVCLRDKWSSKQFKFLSRILAPLLAPEKEKGRKKEKEKKRMKGTLLWKKNLPSSRRGAQNKRWRKRKKKQKIIQRWWWHSKSARNTWTES